MVDNRLHFSVIIPTRDRCDTLASTLQTCVTQDYADVEIIVSDNFSQDRTREVVDSLRDPRIRYLNTGRRLSMSSNWEFALAQATGDYITILGDDDGLLPHSIEQVAGILRDLDDVAALVWSRPIYNWPNHVSVSKRNTLTCVPVVGRSHVNSHEMLARLARAECNWGGLPSIYNGFIRHDIVRRVKQRGNGRFFNSAIPDIYSAIAVASVTDAYYVAARPYALAGVSHHSTGHSFSYAHVADQSAQKFIAENDIPIYPQLVMSSSQWLCTVECFSQARAQGLIPDDLQMDLTTVIRAALLESSEEPDRTYAAILSDLRQVGVQNGLEAFVEESIAKALHSAEADGVPVSGYDFRHKRLVLNGQAFGVKDVFAAVQLCERVLSGERFFYPIGTLRVTLRAVQPYIRKHLTRRLGLLSSKLNLTR